MEFNTSSNGNLSDGATHTNKHAGESDVTVGASLNLKQQPRHDPPERRPSLSQSSPAVAYGQPTILGLSCCLLSLTPASCVLMGWHHTTSASFLALLGSFYLLSGIGLMLAGLLEWFMGNTLNFVTFVAFSGFWLAFAMNNDPHYGVGAAVAQDQAVYASPIGFYLSFWGLFVFLLTLAALRTNVAYVSFLFTVAVALFLLGASFLQLGSGNASSALNLQHAGGAMLFVSCAVGWWMLLNLALSAGGLPFNVPLGDLGRFWQQD